MHQIAPRGLECISCGHTWISPRLDGQPRSIMLLSRNPRKLLPQRSCNNTGLTQSALSNCWRVIRSRKDQLWRCDSPAPVVSSLDRKLLQVRRTHHGNISSRLLIQCPAGPWTWSSIGDTLKWCQDLVRPQKRSSLRVSLSPWHLVH